MYFRVHRCSLRVPIAVVGKWLMLIAVIVIGTVQSEDDPQFSECIHPYFCEPMLGDVWYPFWGNNRPPHCGDQPFKLECHSDNGTYSTIEINSVTYRVLEIDQLVYTMNLVRNDLWMKGACVDVEQRVNTTLRDTPFDYTTTPMLGNLTLFYGCNDPPPPSLQPPNKFTCKHNNGDDETGFYTTEGVLSPETIQLLEATKCDEASTVQVPILNDSMADPLRRGFIVKYGVNSLCSGCINSKGICGSSDSSSSDFLCFCKDQPYLQKCPGTGLDLKRKLIIGFVTASVSIIIMLVIFYFYLRRKKTKDAASLLSRNISSDPSSVMDFEKGNSYHGLGVHVFTYSELEEATNNFDSTKELGDGGFGTVYYGKLKDGRIVAVKRLYEHNYKRVEQFLNEVEILTRLRHKNLVSLYGCTSRHSRELLLVYEYVPNGTVADHLHGERAKPGGLPWSTRMKIAVETADALAYLHASDIIHRDVKTNNILLDSNFCVKVADFGLSRLFPNDVTHVSTAPQGTPGYVDPDYHQCYQLTDKSDVYSFGVVLIELISSKPAVDITRHRHEINLSNLAINKIQSKALHELVDPSLGFETDYKVKMMISAVAELAFGCLQGDKDLRPSMVEVFEALKGIMQTEIYNHTKVEEMDRFPSDGDVLLKSSHDAITLSPDSVTNWSSSG